MERFERKEIVYYLLLGAFDLEEYRPVECVMAPNLFLPGSACSLLWREIFEATERLEARLGIEEDDDVEEIQRAYDKLMQIVGVEMYECGRRVAHWRKGRRRAVVEYLGRERPKRARRRLSEKKD